VLFPAPSEAGIFRHGAPKPTRLKTRATTIPAGPSTCLTAGGEPAPESRFVEDVNRAFFILSLPFSW